MQELQKIVSGRSSSAPDGLLKGFQKTKNSASKALQQALVSPAQSVTAAAPSLKAPELPNVGESLSKALTTSPAQIAKSAAPAVSGSSGACLS